MVFEYKLEENSVIFLLSHENVIIKVFVDNEEIKQNNKSSKLNNFVNDIFKELFTKLLTETNLSVKQMIKNGKEVEDIINEIAEVVKSIK